MLYVYKSGGNVDNINCQPKFFEGTRLNTCHVDSVRGVQIKNNFCSKLWYFEVDGHELHGDGEIKAIVRRGLTIEYKAVFKDVKMLMHTLIELNKFKFGV